MYKYLIGYEICWDLWDGKTHLGQNIVQVNAHWIARKHLMKMRVRPVTQFPCSASQSWSQILFQSSASNHSALLASELLRTSAATNSHVLLRMIIFAKLTQFKQPSTKEAQANYSYNFGTHHLYNWAYMIELITLPITCQEKTEALNRLIACVRMKMK